MPNRRVRIRLKEVLYDKNMTQLELSKRTGIREATISKMCNEYYVSINMVNILTLMNELQIEKLDDFIEIVYVKEESEV